MHRANAALRCKAKSKRSGLRCKAPAVRGKHVCRMHGAGGGAPRGMAHGAYRHGHFSCSEVADRVAISRLIAQAHRAAAGM